MYKRDTLCVIFSYLEESYLYLAPVCKTFKECWRGVPKKTRAITKHTTTKQLEYAFKSGLGKTKSILISCGTIGRTDLIICAFTYGFDEYIPFEVCEEACRNGHIDVVKWYIDKTKEHTLRFDVKACVLAAERGYTDIVKLFNYPDPTRSRARKGYRKRIRVFCNREVSCAAASNGHLGLLQWLVENNCSLHPSDWNVVSNGHTHIIEWMTEWMRGRNYNFTFLR